MSNNVGTLVTSPIRPFSSLDTYPSFYANEGKGGCHNVTSLEERNSIPEDRLTEGMLCTVGTNIYQYIEGEWVGLSIGGTVEPSSLNKYVTTIGDGETDTFYIQHDLGTEHISVTVRYRVNKSSVGADDTVIDDNTVKLTFSEAPTPGEFTVVVIG